MAAKWWEPYSAKKQLLEPLCMVSCFYDNNDKLYATPALPHFFLLSICHYFYSFFFFFTMSTNQRMLALKIVFGYCGCVTLTLCSLTAVEQRWSLKRHCGKYAFNHFVQLQFKEPGTSINLDKPNNQLFLQKVYNTISKARQMTVTVANAFPKSSERFNYNRLQMPHKMKF